MRPSKKDELAERALELFQRQGFRAVGVDTIATTVGMSKTSIYNNFTSKEGLVLACLAKRAESFHQAMEMRIIAAGPDPRARILAAFDALGDWFAADDFSGCAFIRAAAEYPVAGDPVREASRDHKRRQEARIQDLVAALCISKAAARALTAQLMTLIEGATVRAQMGMAPKPDRNARVAAGVLIDAATGDSGV